MFYTIKEIAEKLKVCDTQIRLEIRKGDLKTSRVGKAYRISEEQLQEYLNR